MFYGGGDHTWTLARSSEVNKGHQRSSPGTFLNEFLFFFQIYVCLNTLT